MITPADYSRRVQFFDAVVTIHCPDNARPKRTLVTTGKFLLLMAAAIAIALGIVAAGAICGGML